MDAGEFVSDWAKPDDVVLRKDGQVWFRKAGDPINPLSRSSKIGRDAIVEFCMRNRVYSEYGELKFGKSRLNHYVLNKKALLHLIKKVKNQIDAGRDPRLSLTDESIGKRSPSTLKKPTGPSAEKALEIAQQEDNQYTSVGRR
ncbi:MAG: hypothetical protein SGARI_002078 [Bacillariaceae sp.]